MPLRVLLVEDSEDDALLLERQLDKGGFAPQWHRVWHREDVAAALDTRTWDIVLSDYRLPGFSALDVLAMVRERGLDLPVVIVSGAIGEEAAVEAMHAGAHDYVMKDNIARLAPAIERELEEMAVHRHRREAEAALRESQEHFLQLAGNIDGVLWLIDCAREQMVYVSPAFERLWDQPAHALFQDLNHLLDSIHPEDYERVAALLAEKGWAGFNEEYRIERLDGSVRWIHTRSFPIHDDDGKVYRIAGLSTDVTRRKRLEDEMETLSRALEQSADAVMITDAGGIIEYVNPAFEAVTGYAREEVIGREPNVLHSGFHDEGFYRRLWDSVRNGLPFSEVFINRRKDGELYYEAKTISPVRDEYGEVVHLVSTGKEITERLRQQKEESRAVLHDPQTGLANRAYFLDRLARAVGRAGVLGEHVAVVAVRVDLAELVTPEMDGEVQGELLLQLVHRLLQVAPDGNAVGRLGKDEFAICLREVDGSEAVEAFARRIVDAFAAPVATSGYELYVMPRLGLCLYPDQAEEGRALLDCAHLAAVSGQGQGRAGYRFFEPGMGRPGGERPRRFPD